MKDILIVFLFAVVFYYEYSFHTGRIEWTERVKNKKGKRFYEVLILFIKAFLHQRRLVSIAMVCLVLYCSSAVMVVLLIG